MRLGLLDRDAPEDAILAATVLPDVLETVAKVLAGVVAFISVSGSLLISDGDDRINVVGTLLCVLPWLPWLTGRVSQQTNLLVTAAVLTAVAALAIPDWANTTDSLGFGPQFTVLFPLLVLTGHTLDTRRRVTVVVVAVYVVVLLRAAVAPQPQFQVSGWMLPLVLTTAGIVGMRIGAVEIARAQQAVASLDAEEDQRRITREVHAAVAHTLTVTLLHVSTARTAIRRACSQVAVDALEEAERHGRSSLADVRRIIRLLRSADEDALANAQPDLMDVERLVADYRTAGWAVDLSTSGDLDAVSATAGLAAYRVLQEALANAAHHGRGRTRVEIRVEDSHVEARVTNPVGRREQSRRGAGITRIRERTEAAGGEVSIGRTDGQWEVRARLPCGGVGVS